MLLQTMLECYHKYYGYMCRREVLLGPTAVPRTPQLQPSAAAIYPEPAGAHPILWRAHFPAVIIAQMVSWGNT